MTDQLQRVGEKFVAVEPVREHVAYLRRHGITMTAIAMEIGLTPQAIEYMVRRATRVRTETAEAILDIERQLVLNPERDERYDDRMKGTPASIRKMGPKVPVEFMVRRVRALQVMGYSLGDLSERLGFDVQQRMYLKRGARTTRERHEKVAALYDELWNIPGPSVSARGRALKQGYPGPLEWDDIDNLLEKPKGKTYQDSRRVGRKRTA